MKKIADISIFENLCNNHQAHLKDNVTVFNDLSKLEDIANNCNFKLVKDYDTGDEVSYSLIPHDLGYTFDELQNAIDTYRDAYDSNPHWLKIHQNKITGTSGYDAQFYFLGYIPNQLKKQGKFQVLHGKQNPTEGFYIKFMNSLGQTIGSGSWGGGYDLHEVIENLDFETDEFGPTLNFLFSDLDSFCEKAKATIQLAKEYKKFLANKKKKA